jgi:hypothetical protein
MTSSNVNGTLDVYGTALSYSRRPITKEMTENLLSFPWPPAFVTETETTCFHSVIYSSTASEASLLMELKLVALLDGFCRINAGLVSKTKVL